MNLSTNFTRFSVTHSWDELCTSYLHSMYSEGSVRAVTRLSPMIDHPRLIDSQVEISSGHDYPSLFGSLIGGFWGGSCDWLRTSRPNQRSSGLLNSRPSSVMSQRTWWLVVKLVSNKVLTPVVIILENLFELSCFSAKLGVAYLLSLLTWKSIILPVREYIFTTILPLVLVLVLEYQWWPIGLFKNTHFKKFCGFWKDC